MSGTRSGIAQKLMDRYIGTEVPVEDLAAKGYDKPKGRVFTLFFSDCNVSINVKCTDNQVIKAPDGEPPVGRLIIRDVEVLEFLRAGKERVQNNKTKERVWRPYSVLDAWNYGDIEIQGGLKVGEVKLVSKALDEVVRPALAEKR